MIKVNGHIVNVNKFPDGTQCLLKFNEHLFDNDGTITTPYYEIVWTYENDEELFTLLCVTEHIREYCVYGSNSVINLVMPYVANARMDRTYSTSEIFTLKHFAKFINNLKFNKVGVFDPHSNVTIALINRVITMDDVLEDCVKTALLSIGDDFHVYDFNWKDTVIYFPDEGAYKRYSKLAEVKMRKVLFGKKVRDWETGQILGLEIYNDKGEKATEDDVKDKNILMIDDIIAYGGTLAYGADKLKELGANKIYAYASHTENSILDQEKGTLLKRIDHGIVEKLFTTNSIFNGKHRNIEIVYDF